MRKAVVVISAICIVLALTAPATSQESAKQTTNSSHAQSSLEKASSAPQTIYIDSPPDAQPIKKEITQKLQQWGEITVVYLPEKADLILELDQSGKLSASGTGNRGSVVLKNRRTGEDVWSQSRGGAWSMRGWSNAWVGKRLGADLVNFLTTNQIRIDRAEPRKQE